MGNDDKEVYKLWREYLKRSDTYKKYCEWMRRFQKDFKTPRPIEFTNDMDAIFVMFRDVHKELFNEWWKRNVSMEIRHFINEFSVFSQRIFPV